LVVKSVFLPSEGQTERPAARGAVQYNEKKRRLHTKIILIVQKYENALFNHAESRSFKSTPTIVGWIGG